VPNILPIFSIFVIFATAYMYNIYIFLNGLNGTIFEIILMTIHLYTIRTKYSYHILGFFQLKLLYSVHISRNNFFIYFQWYSIILSKQLVCIDFWIIIHNIMNLYQWPTYPKAYRWLHDWHHIMRDYLRNQWIQKLPITH